ncbi:hypothetical protein KQI36_07740 [Clostridium senegalense]|uniref:hypothetical protein n=1 Tax=Clostridium senegalense TaxID=1465809 RepID=UPI001C0F98A2|nr:hypothetical protein [Clostridium senegalense]MBU5226535.1 hypothetical protein [Clostridium senegalense]
MDKGQLTMMEETGLLVSFEFKRVKVTLRELQNELLPPWEKVVKRLNKNGKVVKAKKEYKGKLKQDGKLTEKDKIS